MLCEVTPTFFPATGESPRPAPYGAERYWTDYQISGPFPWGGELVELKDVAVPLDPAARVTELASALSEGLDKDLKHKFPAVWPVEFPAAVLVEFIRRALVIAEQHLIVMEQDKLLRKASALVERGCTDSAAWAVLRHQVVAAKEVNFRIRDAARCDLARAKNAAEEVTPAFEDARWDEAAHLNNICPVERQSARRAMYRASSAVSSASASVRDSEAPNCALNVVLAAVTGDAAQIIGELVEADAIKNQYGTTRRSWLWAAEWVSKLTNYGVHP